MKRYLIFLLILALSVPTRANLTMTEGLGIDLSSAGAGLDVTVAFDLTEILGSRTWGDASTDTIVWTFNRATGTDPTITFNSGSIALQALTLTTDLAVTEGGTGASTLNDLITLTTHTTGNYVASITNGAGITGGDGGSEGAALTIAATLGTAIDTSEITDATIAFADIDNTITLAGNPTLAASEAWFGTTGVIFEGLTADLIEGLLTVADVAATDKTWTLPNTTGTILLDADIGVSIQAYDATLSDIADGTIAENLVNTANPWAVNEGGTGAATLTDGGILLGTGTSAIHALGVATNGQIPIGDGTTDPVLATITGTASEVTVTNGAGTITLDLPLNAGTDITADLEEEAHASEHQDAGADEIAVTAGMMNAGTGASASTYWRGDNTWATPAGSGDMTKAVYDVLNDGFVDGNDTAYAASWNANINAPSMNAVYDKIQAINDHASVTVTDSQSVNLTLSTQNIVADVNDKDYGDVVVSGTGAVWAVDDDSHAHTTTTLSGIDISADTNLAGDTEIVLTGDALSIAAAITRDAEVPGLETNAAVDTEAELEAILGIGFGASKVATSGYILVADGTDFESVIMSGDVTILAGGATAVGDDSHAHTTTTISGIDISADTNLTAGTNITLTGDDLSVDDVFILNTGDIGTGVYDFGGATTFEIPNTAGNVTLAVIGQVALDSTNKQLAVYDGVEKAIPLVHSMQFHADLAGAWDVDAEWQLLDMDRGSATFPNGIVILNWYVDCSKADPTTELNANLYYCDALASGAFPGATPVLVDVLDTTTGNSSETNMALSDLGSGIIPTAKILYVLIDADPTDATTVWSVTINYYIPES